MDIRKLPDAWEMFERMRGEDSRQKESLFEIYYQISTAIFDYRIKHNLSQKKLAEKLGVTQPMVTKLESGDYNYTVEQLWKIATKLGFNFNIEFSDNGCTVVSVPDEMEEIIFNINDTDRLAVGA